MRSVRIITSLLLCSILFLGIVAYTAPRPSEAPTSVDARAIHVGGGGLFGAGARNVVLHIVDIADAGTDTFPTAIEYVCVQRTAATTLLDEYIQQLKLFFVRTPTLFVNDGDVAIPGPTNIDVIFVGTFPNGIKQGRITLSVTGGAPIATLGAPAAPPGLADVNDTYSVVGGGTGQITITFNDKDGTTVFAPPGAANVLIATVPVTGVAAGSVYIVPEVIADITDWAGKVIRVNPRPGAIGVGGAPRPPAYPSLRVTEELLGIIRRPDFDADANGDGYPDGACFGRAGRLLFEVPDGKTVQVRVEADLRYDAPDGLTFQPVTTFVASNGLLGGPAESSGFTEVFPSVTGNITTIHNATGEADAQLTPEANDLDAEPSSKGVVLGRFLLEDFGGAHPTLLSSLALFLKGLRGGEEEPAVLDGIRSLSLYSESGATTPGFQPGDHLMARVNQPTRLGQFLDMDGDGTAETLAIVLGRRGRTMVQIPNPGAARFYIVADLGPEFQNDDEIVLGVIPGAQDRNDQAVSSRIDLTPGTFIELGSVRIAGPAPTIVLADTTVSSTGKMVVSLKNIPAPGLESLTATFIIDVPIDGPVADFAKDIPGNPKVRALGNYDVMAYFDLDGNLVVMVTLKPGRKAATGDFDLLEIELEAAARAAAGAETEITVDPWAHSATLADGTRFVMDIDPALLTVRLIKGDVDGDGVVTRRDAREVALFIVGRSTLSWSITKQRQADVAAPFCDPDFLDDPARTAPACIDASDVRMIMLAAYGHVTLGAAAVEPLQVNAIALTEGAGYFTLAVEGQGVASTELQLYNLGGSLVLEKEAMGNSLQFQPMNEWGEALANGVYLYVVTVKGFDGSIIKSEIRKLVILR